MGSSSSKTGEEDDHTCGGGKRACGPGRQCSSNNWCEDIPPPVQQPSVGGYEYVGCFEASGISTNAITNNNIFSHVAPQFYASTMSETANNCYAFADSRDSRYFATLAVADENNFLKPWRGCLYNVDDDNGNRGNPWVRPAASCGDDISGNFLGMRVYRLLKKTKAQIAIDEQNERNRLAKEAKDAEDARLAAEAARLARVQGEAYNYLNERQQAIDNDCNKPVIAILNRVTGIRDTIDRYIRFASPACDVGDNNMTEALLFANGSLSFANLALQKSELARILSQDLSKQQQAMDMAKDALLDVISSESHVLKTNEKISNANTQYEIVRTNSISTNSETSNIPSERDNAITKFNNARAVSTNLQVTMITSLEVNAQIRDALKFIRIPAGYTTLIFSDNRTEQDTSTEGTIKTNVDLIKFRIDTEIQATKTGMAGLVTRANDPTKRNNCNSLTQQATSTLSLIRTKAENIIASAQREIIRIKNLNTIKINQNAQLEAADEIRAAELRAEYAAADEARSKRDLKEASTRATKAQLAYERSLVQVESVNKQYSLQDRINRNIFDINNMTTIEEFANTPLATETNQETNNYVKSFNNSLSLLDDPNNMNRAAFDTYLHIQDTKIASLKSNLNTLQKKASENNNKNAPVKGIRSMYNSAILNVEEYPNGNPKQSKYLIYGNTGCLQYDLQNQQNAPSISFRPCDSNQLKQQFNINQINNLDQYNNPITNKNNSLYKINHKTNVNFGFYTVNPSNASDQCLQLNNDGISVMPCNMNSEQRFGTNYYSVV